MDANERNAMRGKLENLIPKIDELDKDWVCDWDDETQEKFYVIVHGKANTCFITSDRTNQRIGAIYMSSDTALYIKKMIDKKLKLIIRDDDGNVVVGG